ncbi:MAG: hypothetical protein QOG05_935 [Streptosporangiaceae bacterium]|nr:hypothetical protein [Streptosporangiaceae bacterium]
MRSDDLAPLLTYLDAGPARVLGSSGGAVTALALANTRTDSFVSDAGRSAADVV